MAFVARLRGAAGLRHAPVFLAWAWCLAAASSFAEARVVDVRVGLHADHTRVVIELDQPGTHRTTRDASGDSLSIALDAKAARRRVVSRGPLVSAVSIEPKKDGAVARITLREPGVEVSELRLDSPPRIVIDLRRGSVAKRAPAPIAPAPAPAAPAATDDADEIAEAPSPDDSPAPAAKRTGRDPFATPSGYEALVAAQRSAGGGLAPVESPPAAPAPAPANAPPPREAGPPPTPARPSIARVEAPPAVVTPPVSAPASVPAPGASLLGRIASVDAAPFVLLLVGLLAVWFVYRRLAASRTRRVALDEDADLFGDAIEARDEAPAHVAPAEPAGPLFAWDSSRESEAVEREDERPAVALSLVPPPEPEPEHEFETGPDAEPALEVAVLEAVEPEAAAGWTTLAVPQDAPTAEPAIAAAFEERIARLEATIEELRDARERLERFAAAQNEELRVQRAAIARTQRVIRGLTRSEDGTEGPQPTVE